MRLLRRFQYSPVVKGLLAGLFGPAMLCPGVLNVNAAPTPPIRAHEVLNLSRIRVRLTEASSKVVVRGLGLRVFEAVPAKRSPAAQSRGGLEARSWELRCQNGRVRARPLHAEGGHGGDAIDLQEPVRIQAASGTLLYNDRTYREELRVHSVGSFCDVVNYVDIEKYLSGLVNSEFSSKWSEEAIGAQIVAARTYALHQMRIARGDSDRRYDVDASVSDQVYDGSLKEDPRSQRLVEKTRGWVLTTGPSTRPAPLKAFYHSTCGGMTELPEHVWGASYAGFKRPVKCPFCNGSPALNWQLDLTQADVAEAFRRAFVSSEERSPGWARGWPRQWRLAIAGKRLANVRAGAWDGEGRVSEVITTWTVVDPKTGRRSAIDLRVSGARFRDWVGPAKFRSASFQVIGRSAGVWRFQGRGNGHGVGMCQWGAKTMGERGFKTSAILKHYYPDAVLRKLW